MSNEMDCPYCDTPGLEIGNYHIHTSDSTVEIYYAICNVNERASDPYGDYALCEFFIVRESKEALIKALRAYAGKYGDE